MVNASLVNQLKRQQRYDRLFVSTTRLFAYLVLMILGGVLASLMYGAYPSIQHFGVGFLTSSNWDTVAGEFGALAPIYGTLITSAIALMIATPVSFGIAVFLTEFCPELFKKPLAIYIELLAGIPSIIYGMWGLFVFAPFFAKYIQPALAATLGQLPILDRFFAGVPMGIGILAAGFILAIMIIPFIASVMKDVFEITPPVLKESAYGLGATRLEVIRHVVLPYTKSGVVGGVILGLGRALGETMAVTFIIGNAFNLSTDLFGAGVSITSVLANEFAEAMDPMHISSLLFLGLILFVITFLVLCLSKLMLMNVQSKTEH